MNIKKIQKRALMLLITITFATSTLGYYTTPIFAASTTVHVRIVGASQTIWYGDVPTTGCTVTDTSNIQHTYTQSVAVCAIDVAAKAGGFTYAAKDFGGSLGLFLQKIGQDAGSSDFSTYWSYDLNGKAASQGISSQVVAAGDSLYFHFEDPNADPNKRAITDGINYLRSQQLTTGQINGFTGVSDWSAMTFVANGIDIANVKNSNISLLDYLSANPPMSSSNATDWEKRILAIIASGNNPYSFGGVNYVKNLETYHTNAQIGAATQINDDIFGLLALLSAGSGASSQTEQDALNFILSHQGTDGGFSWSTTGPSDVDDTAAALQALTAAKNAGMTVINLSTAITNAENYILAAKNTDGGFASTKGDASNTSTTSWVVMALNALGVTDQDIPNADAYIRSNQGENGSFAWQPSSTGETFTTSYAVLALTGKYWPVKIFVRSTPIPSPSPSSTPIPSPTVTPKPSPTITPTGTPVPSVTLSQSPTPSPSITPKTNDRFQEIVRHEQERLHKLQEQQRRIFEKIQAQIQKELNNLSRFFNALGKHR